MPINSYYGGKGRKVMRGMKDRYGSEKGERVFYATANKKDKGNAHSKALEGLKRAQ